MRVAIAELLLREDHPRRIDAFIDYFGDRLLAVARTAHAEAA